MVTMKIRLYKDSAGVLYAEFKDGLNSVSQNNANVNAVVVALDGFELSQGEILRIAFEKVSGTCGEEMQSWVQMQDNNNGTYLHNLSDIITKVEAGTKWKLNLQIASNWAGLDHGYTSQQNLFESLVFAVTNDFKTPQNKYATQLDIAQLYANSLMKDENGTYQLGENANIAFGESLVISQEFINMQKSVYVGGGQGYTEICVFAPAGFAIGKIVNGQQYATTYQNGWILKDGVLYSFPAKVQNDTFAMLSDIKATPSDIVSTTDDNYRITLKLKDLEGNAIGNGVVIDLPTEEIVVSGRYDSTNNNIVLVLRNGNEVAVPLENLVRGLATQAYAESVATEKAASALAAAEAYTDEKSASVLDEAKAYTDKQLGVIENGSY